MKTEVPADPTDILKTLLDETRLMILGALASGPRNPQALSAGLKLDPRVTTKHLSMLEHFGFIRRRPKGGEYEIDVTALHEMKKSLFFEGSPTPAADEESSILNRFVTEDRLKQLPSKHTHRLVILRWLSEKFEPGTKYPEKAVNEILEDHHPDFASLRRALVDYGYMDRKDGYYWRTEGIPGAQSP